MFEFAAFVLGLFGVQQLVSSSVEARSTPAAAPPATTPAVATPAAAAPATAAAATPEASAPAEAASPAATASPASSTAPAPTDTVDFGVPGAPPPKAYFVKMADGIQTFDEGKVPDLPHRLSYYQTQSTETLAGTGGVRRVTGALRSTPAGDKSIFTTVDKTTGPDTVERVFMAIDAVSAIASSSPPPMFEIFIVPVALVGNPFGRSGDPYLRVE